MNPLDLMDEFIQIFFGTFVGLLAIVDPLGVLPVWIALTKQYDRRQKKVLAKRTFRYIIVIMLLFLFLGNAILDFFSISMSGIRIAGGLLMLTAAFDLVLGENKRRRHKAPNRGKESNGSEHELHQYFPEQDAKSLKEQQKREETEPEADDIAFSPMAMPLLSGPGAIAVILSMTGDAGNPWESPQTYVAGCLAIVVICTLTYFVLDYSHMLAKRLNRNTLNAMTRFMGFILLAIGVQFLLGGLSSMFGSEMVK